MGTKGAADRCGETSGGCGGRLRPRAGGATGGPGGGRRRALGRHGRLQRLAPTAAAVADLGGGGVYDGIYDGVSVIAARGGEGGTRVCGGSQFPSSIFCEHHSRWRSLLYFSNGY